MEQYLNSLNTSSWYGAELGKIYIFILWYLVKHKDNFTFTSTMFYVLGHMYSKFNFLLNMLYLIYNMWQPIYHIMSYLFCKFVV
jgi:hypothetical protein